MEWAVLALDSHLVDARASSHSGFGVASALWCPKTLHKAPLTQIRVDDYDRHALESRDGQTTTKRYWADRCLTAETANAAETTSAAIS